MSFVESLSDTTCMLAEGAVSERLRRMGGIELHPTLFNTPLIYQEKAAQSMAEIYGEYRNIALGARLPILLCAPTWRASRHLSEQAGLGMELNRDAVHFMRALERRWQHPDSSVFVGGLLAPKNDCYTPAVALSEREAESFHGWQIDELVQAGVDCIVAQTMPALSEATGMGRSLGRTGCPYLLSFVIDKRGALLDGTPLAQAVATLDDTLPVPPAAYMVNCAYPSFLCPDEQPAELFTRVLGIQANASSQSHDQLDGAKQIQQDPLEDWGRQMLRLNRQFGVKILGGCCGTDDTYLRYLVRN